jgi:hypothetical protein
MSNQKIAGLNPSATFSAFTLAVPVNGDYALQAIHRHFRTNLDPCALKFILVYVLVAFAVHKPDRAIMWCLTVGGTS